MSASNLRQNPFTGAYSPRTITNEAKTVAEFDFLPGIYGFRLDDKPSPDTDTITFITDDTAAIEYTIITSGNPSAGQVRYSAVNGICVFNVANNEQDFLVSYDGYGTNMSVEAVNDLSSVPTSAQIGALTELLLLDDLDEFMVNDVSTLTTKRLKNSTVSNKVITNALSKTAITALGVGDKFLVSDASDSNNPKTITEANVKLSFFADEVITTIADADYLRIRTSGAVEKIIAYDTYKILSGFDGWVPGEAWTYASATTFTITGNQTTKYYPGMKLKLTQTTVKYFYIVSVSFSSVTTITVWGGVNFSLANAAITSSYYSFHEAPTGLPTKKDFGWGAVWRANTHAGFGGTDTQIPYFTNVTENSLANVATIVNNSTNGLKMTTRVAGIYAMEFHATGAAAAVNHVGISLNSNQLTTSIVSITDAHRLALCLGDVGQRNGCSKVTINLALGDVLRPHTNAATPNNTNLCGVTICLIEPLF